MRQFNKLVITPLLFGLTACVPVANNQTLTDKTIIDKMTLVNGGGGRGGNPEVNLNQCFELTNQARKGCFDIFYPNDINITTYPSSGDIIRLAGRKSSIEKKEFNLRGKERFIFYVDTSNTKLPLSCNIKHTKLSQERGSVVVDIDVKEIENNITLKDREGRVVLDYHIVK